MAAQPQSRFQSLDPELMIAEMAQVVRLLERRPSVSDVTVEEKQEGRAGKRSITVIRTKRGLRVFLQVLHEAQTALIKTSKPAEIKVLLEISWIK